MIFFDALVFNPDRHTSNFGLLRDKKTGEYISMAPCFDHNMALIANGYPTGKTRKDLLITLFTDFVKQHLDYSACIPIVTREKIEAAIRQTGMKVRSDVIVRYVLERYGSRSGATGYGGMT